MKTYYLQRLPYPNERLIIDDHVHKGAIVHEETQASCWLSAKIGFGFPLTRKQEVIRELSKV